MTAASDHPLTDTERCQLVRRDTDLSVLLRHDVRSLLERHYGLLAPELIELVDALVAAIDVGRAWEVERLSVALEPFGASGLFASELRLNGTPSPSGCICDGEGWL